MLRICLAEDEAYALKSLQQKIADLGENYEVVGCAYNGIDALELIAELRPDIVLTDIRMPDMDGIAMLAEMRARGDRAVVVIISGYQEFDYAKRAIQLGAEDYLLKPVATGELRECLARCENKITRLRNAANIDDILAGGAPAVWESAYLLAYCIFGNTVKELDNIVHPSGMYIPSRSVESRFKEKLAENGSAFCFIGVHSNEKVIMIQGGHMDEALAEAQLRMLAEELEAEYRLPVTIAFRHVERDGQTGEQIGLCRKIAAQSVLLGESNVVRELSGTDYATPDLNEVISRLTAGMIQGKPEALRAEVQALCESWQKRRCPLPVVQNDLIYIINALKHSLSATGGAEFTISYYIETMLSLSGSFDDLAASLCALLVELFSAPHPGDANAISPAKMVEKIELYFQRNLTKDISLAMLCEEMNYSKGYLCRVFKKIKDMTPIDYFIQLKIERAKVLIRQNPAVPMREIADSLGFNDVYYFSRVFKRVTGQTPSAVRSEGVAVGR